MNCKPGDLAVVVGATNANESQFIGSLLRCIRLYEPNCSFYGTNEWEYEPVSTGLPDGPEHTVDDSILRPIRPQDDDATDESHAWLPPVPSRETA